VPFPAAKIMAFMVDKVLEIIILLKKLSIYIND
jgi:hypothetical protein